MKWYLAALILLFSLAGCGQPVGSTTPLAGSTAEPTATLEETEDRATPTARAPESPIGVFDVYLVKQDISPQQMIDADLSELRLEDTPLLSIDDIAAYSWETHEMELTAYASERMARLEISRLGMAGLPFVVCAGGERIYGGALWTSYSSVPYDGIVIDVYPASSGQPLPIQLGYPSPEWFRGEDLRFDERIRQALEEWGKLR